MSAATNVNAMQNLRVPLPDALHRALLEESARSGRPAVAIVREAVEAYLHDCRRAAVHEELAAYAERWAGTLVDFDEALATAPAQRRRGLRAASAPTPKACPRRGGVRCADQT